MKKFIQNKLKDQKGLTLIELLAVIVILAIIAAIAIPAIGNIIENSRYSAVKADATNVLSAAQVYYTENADQTSVSINKLTTDGFLTSPGKIDSTSGNAASNFVTKATDGKMALTTAEITFSGSKKVKFTGATVAGINSNTTKGSAIGTTTETISN